MEELLILVDEDDKEVGFSSKLNTHRYGKLHRAFSLFVYDKETDSLLLQQRAKDKYHSGGLWTNTCCSHPRRGEKLWISVIRRMKEEMGVTISEKAHYDKDLREIGKFRYYKKFGVYSEYEIDHVFVWNASKEDLKIDPNYNEIEDYKWVKISDLEDWLIKSPSDFTAWFFEAFEIFAEHELLSGNGAKRELNPKLTNVLQVKKGEVSI